MLLKSKRPDKLYLISNVHIDNIQRQDTLLSNATDHGISVSINSVAYNARGKVLQDYVAIVSQRPVTNRIINQICVAK